MVLFQVEFGFFPSKEGGQSSQLSYILRTFGHTKCNKGGTNQTGDVCLLLLPFPLGFTLTSPLCFYFNLLLRLSLRILELHFITRRKRESGVCVVGVGAGVSPRLLAFRLNLRSCAVKSRMDKSHRIPPPHSKSLRSVSSAQISHRKEANGVQLGGSATQTGLPCHLTHLV